MISVCSFPAFQRNKETILRRIIFWSYAGKNRSMQRRYYVKKGESQNESYKKPNHFIYVFVSGGKKC